jgi:hypothetical protein
LELGQTQVISLTDTGVGAGEYLGERINIQEQGWWRWRRETVGQVESEHFGNAGEAIEWLVEKIAPCVIAAGGLALRKPQ